MNTETVWIQFCMNTERSVYKKYYYGLFLTLKIVTNERKELNYQLKFSSLMKSVFSECYKLKKRSAQSIIKEYKIFVNDKSIEDFEFIKLFYKYKFAILF